MAMKFTFDKPKRLLCGIFNDSKMFVEVENCLLFHYKEFQSVNQNIIFKMIKLSESLISVSSN